MSCELVCTGWYSTEAPRNYLTFGDDLIRNPDFRALWWQSLDTFIKPENVLIVDSASPVKPQDQLCTTTNFKYIELLKNPGHSQNCPTHYCGYMASVILGLEFALLNDVDFFLYVEQDALIYGDGFVDKIKTRLLKNDLVFGNGGKFGGIQQSVFAANKKGIRRFLSAMHQINFSDRQISPEMKFMYAASWLSDFPFAGLMSHDNPKLTRRASMSFLLKLMSLMRSYDFLPFGYGRLRPINFNDEFLYFQHGSLDEINSYRKLTGFN